MDKPEHVTPTEELAALLARRRPGASRLLEQLQQRAAQAVDGPG
jgi:hypothetical protein